MTSLPLGFLVSLPDILPTFLKGGTLRGQSNRPHVSPASMVEFIGFTLVLRKRPQLKRTPGYAASPPGSAVRTGFWEGSSRDCKASSSQ